VSFRKPSPSYEETASFAGLAARLDAELKRAGVPYHDMRREQQLEVQLIGPSGADRETNARAGRVDIERLEGPVTARPIPSTAAPSRIRYFLDGSQRTFPAYLFGSVPVIASITAAAVLARDGDGNPRVASGMLRLRHSWLAPRRVPEIAPFLQLVERVGMDVVDPLAGLDDEAAYAEAAADYGRLIEFGHKAANRLRAGLEVDLLRRWSGRPGNTADDGWIVVDGTLPFCAPRAVGLVKSFTRQYLTGEEAARMFQLTPGQRTSAFQVADLWRGDERLPDGEGDDRRTLWFLRMWDAAGRDARHSLVRIEAAPDMVDSQQIDELSAWLLAERAPRAMADTRWATLLYPVHYLERILKRYVDADTRGWPGARAGA
jgi:hypothetical protein